MTCIHMQLGPGQDPSPGGNVAYNYVLATGVSRQELGTAVSTGGVTSRSAPVPGRGASSLRKREPGDGARMAGAVCFLQSED